MSLNPALTGLSAFPLTPFKDEQLDLPAFIRILEKLAAAGPSQLDSITVLGSTGLYPYLNADERELIIRRAMGLAGQIPVFAGVGALRTRDVLAHVRAAEEAGASGILLAPMTYQPLPDDDVFGLYADVTSATELPVIVYDNPGTTHVDFSLELYERIAQLPGIASIKIPGVPADPGEARAHVEAIRAVVPEHVSIGVSGDAFGAPGLNAGCDAWYSVFAGTVPELIAPIAQAALAGEAQKASELSDQLEPLWQMCRESNGSIRVIAALATHLGLAERSCLPLPIRGLDDAGFERVGHIVRELGALASL